MRGLGSIVVVPPDRSGVGLLVKSLVPSRLESAIRSEAEGLVAQHLIYRLPDFGLIYPLPRSHPLEVVNDLVFRAGRLLAQEEDLQLVGCPTLGLPDLHELPSLLED